MRRSSAARCARWQSFSAPRPASRSMRSEVRGSRRLFPCAAPPRRSRSFSWTAFRSRVPAAARSTFPLSPPRCWKSSSSAEASSARSSEPAHWEVRWSSFPGGRGRRSREAARNWRWVRSGPAVFPRTSSLRSDLPPASRRRSNSTRPEVITSSLVSTRRSSPTLPTTTRREPTPTRGAPESWAARRGVFSPGDVTTGSTCTG